MPGPFHWLMLIGGLWVLFGVFWFWWISRQIERLAFADAGEVRVVELPTKGHHIALVHHPSPHRKFVEPVIVCHGVAVNRFNMDFHDDGRGSDRVSLARALARAGFDTWVLELRGRGHAKVPRGADWSIDDEVDEDVPTAIASVLAATGAERLFWVGHSKGSILQYLFQSTGHPLAQKIAGFCAIGSPGTLRFTKKYVAPLLPLGALILGVFGRVPLRAAARWTLPLVPLIRWAGRPIVRDLEHIDAPMLARVFGGLTSDIQAGVARQLIAWTASRDGAMTRRDGRSYEADFGKITAPVLFLAGVNDRLAPPEAVEHVFARVGSTDKTLLVMGKGLDASHDYGHGDLVIGPHAPTEVFPRVLQWLEGRARLSASHPQVASPATKPE